MKNSEFRWSVTGTVLAVVTLVCVIVAASSFTIVQPGHRGVAVTLGKVQEMVRPEGINFTLPWVTTITQFPIKQITQEGESVCFSSDLQTINVKFNVLYRIPEGKVVTLFQNYAGDPYHALVEPRVQEILKQQAALHRAEEIVKKREQIKAAVLAQAQAVMGDIITIRDVVINNIDLTKELEQAIEQKQVMEQAALQKQYELQKELKEAEITIVKAKAEAEAVQIKGKALKSSPEVIQLEIAKRWNGVAPLSVSTTAGGANILLPLK